MEAEFARRWRALSRPQRQFTVTTGGIVLGVLLLLSAILPLQALGALLVALGLLSARFGERVPEAWLLSPRAALPPLDARVRGLATRWLWPGFAGLLLAALLALLVKRLFLEAPVTSKTMTQAAKGLFGLLMLSSLALWHLPAMPRWRRLSRLTSGRLFRLAEPAQAPDDPSGVAPGHDPTTAVISAE